MKQWDKINGDVAFYEDEHKYINIKNPLVKYTSVTTLISEFYEKFDSEFMSKYKALEELTQRSEAFLELKANTRMTQTKVWKDEYLSLLGVDAEEHVEVVKRLISEWTATNEEACTIGTAIHLERENEHYEDSVNEIVTRYTGLTGEFNCVKHDFSLSRVQSVMPEYLVYYSCPEGILNIAGQVDVVIKDGNDISILDFKTNRKGIAEKAFFVKGKGYKKMYYPVNNLHDTTMSHYTLQLSIYAWMLQKINPDFNIKLLKLIHIDRDGKETEFEVPYLKEEVQRMLAFKKAKLKDKNFKNKQRYDWGDN